ncbi:MAG: DMT family transporter [Lachnospiraceae bacterium]|nr:DMT family transporter [Lachnospiraceae bacterium]
MKKSENRDLWKNTVVVCICATLCCFLWGSAFPGIKYGYSLFDIGSDNTGLQIIFAGLRFTLAGLMVVVIGSLMNRRALLPKRESVLKIVHLSLLQTTGQYFFFYVGLAQTTGVKSSIIQATNVFIALFVAVIIYKQERLSRNKIIGSVIGFVGVVIIELYGQNAAYDNGNFIGVGEICVLLSTVAYAFSSVYIKKYSKDEMPMILSGYQFIVGGITLLAMGMIWSRFTPGEISLTMNMHRIIDGMSKTENVVIVLYLAAVSAIAYTLWGTLLKYNSVSKISVFGFLTPVFGVILSAAVLGEAQTMNMVATVVALILVSIGTLLAQRPVS